MFSSVDVLSQQDFIITGIFCTSSLRVADIHNYSGNYQNSVNINTTQKTTLTVKMMMYDNIVAEVTEITQLFI